VRQEATPADREPGATFDPEVLLDRLSGDVELMDEVIHLFLEDCPVRLERIRDAVTRRDAGDVRREAHAIKGGASNLSATRLAEAASALEQAAADSDMDAVSTAWCAVEDEATALTDVLSRMAGASRAAPDTRGNDATPVRVLIADDDRMTTVMLARALERWGYEVAVAHDGTAAWAHISGSAPPALAILDWMMPGLDGLALCRRIRDASLPTPMYVILLTSRSSREDLVAGLEAGADDYLTKPFDPEELRARVHVGERTLALIASIKRLTGLLPICAYCKRIRSDKNYWSQVEHYITEHTDARFSHGICPDCYQKVRAEFEAPDPVR
jgi:CheY-like chemotaxis protein